LVRYRPGDFIKVISLENEEVGIRLPQIIPDGRADRIIDIAGFTRLSERVMWQALENLGIRYEGWMIRKELEDKEPVLRLYLATDETDLDRLQEEIHQSLKKFEPDYADLESMSGLKPLRLKPLPYGVFERYTELRRAAGSDPGQLKAQCMAPSDEVVETILKLAEN
ncbi:MAG: GH3 auxin-responsive promoter family protein, partial [Anaerolineae bacterium]